MLIIKYQVSQQICLDYRETEEPTPVILKEGRREGRAKKDKRERARGGERGI